PKARAKRQVALVNAAEQPLFAAGSYIYLQQLQFEPAPWQRLSVAEQEDIMGCDKVSARPLPSMLPDSHTALLRPEQVPLPTVLQQNMPYYQVKPPGLLQLGYAATAEALHQQ